MFGEIVMMARGNPQSSPTTALFSHLSSLVYALYDQKRWLLIVFACLLAAESIVVIIGLLITLPEPDFQVIQILTNIPSSFAYLACVCFESLY